MRSMQLSFSQLCNPLLCSGLVSLLPRFTTILQKRHIRVFVCVCVCDNPKQSDKSSFPL